MLNHPTLEKMYQLRLHGMPKAFKEQMEQPEADGPVARYRAGDLYAVP